MNQNLVLIAEDDRDVRELLSFSLESAGYRTVGARDGRTALRILHTARPVALITDVLMPDMNGIELCRLVRKTGDSRTAILMVSANVHQHDMEAGLRVGADRYLPKPVTPRRLVAEMRDVITGKFAAAPATDQNPIAVPASSRPMGTPRRQAWRLCP
ncbi:response regulator [Actinoplanes sp. NPDC049802]|uniref:response regulator transcription factor n=1 Tax=Actinoplanes sp. NPDC049802 TaxID=3154742 RepID=UPI0033CCE684